MGNEEALDENLISNELLEMAMNHQREILGFMLNHFGSCENCAAKWTKAINERAGREVIHLVKDIKLVETQEEE